jgi:hypothetical protein
VLCGRAASVPEVAGDAALLFDPRDSEAIVTAIDRVARPVRSKIRPVETLKSIVGTRRADNA